MWVSHFVVSQSEPNILIHLPLVSSSTPLPPGYKPGGTSSSGVRLNDQR